VVKVVTNSRREELLQVKLRALVSDRWSSGGDPGRFPGGAALFDPSSRVAWVLAEEQPERALGGALAWALRQDVTHVHVLVEMAGGTLARQAQAFELPIEVWQVSGRSTAVAMPEPLRPEPALAADDRGFADRIRALGADPVVERGVLMGEVLGLEVCRVVDGRLEVGVGKHDREAHGELLGPAPGASEVETALQHAIATVREWRRADARPHPANQLAPERWLRHVIVDRPSLVGAAHLAPVPSPVDRNDLRALAPAPAAGVDLDDRPLLVVCSVGVDTALVPLATDARMADGRNPRLLLAVPEGDDHPVTRRLAAALVEPSEVVTVPADWRAG
jgi:hypothetical protein